MVASPTWPSLSRSLSSTQYCPCGVDADICHRFRYMCVWKGSRPIPLMVNRIRRLMFRAQGLHAISADSGLHDSLGLPPNLASVRPDPGSSTACAASSGAKPLPRPALLLRPPCRRPSSPRAESQDLAPSLQSGDEPISVGNCEFLAGMMPETPASSRASPRRLPRSGYSSPFGQPIGHQPSPRFADGHHQDSRSHPSCSPARERAATCRRGGGTAETGTRSLSVKQYPRAADESACEMAHFLWFSIAPNIGARTENYQMTSCRNENRLRLAHA